MSYFFTHLVIESLPLMRIEDYQKRKMSEAQKLAAADARKRFVCLDCLRPPVACLCKHIKAFATNIHFCILMHPKEARKQKVGTGRLTHLILKNSQIIVDENFDDNPHVQKILNGDEYEPYLLYPGKNSTNLTTDKFQFKEPTKKKPLIFILDGTWPCAKSMMRESRCLHHLPRLSFSHESTSRFVIKHQPAKYCLSTIESVYVLLSHLEALSLEETENKKENLLELLEQLVKFQIKCASDPNLNHYRRDRDCSRPYKDPSERVNSKKWESRLICFEQ